MKVVYVAGPYRANTMRGVVENIRRAEAIAYEFWRAGYAVLCPHMNTAMFDGEISNQQFVAGDLEMLRRLKPEIVFMLRGWEKSEGAKAERDLAIELRYNIVHEG